MVKTFNVPEKLEKAIGKKFPIAEHTMCKQICFDHPIFWGCTRPKGHKGPHVACGTDGDAYFAWIEEDNDG